MKNLNFKEVSVMVIGDIMLDVYHYGKVDRISPEAPVPVISVSKTKNQPGGAANVANNISGLMGRVFLFGYAGKDENAGILERLLKAANINFFFERFSNPTITKTRIIGQHQQMVRLDFEEKIAANEQEKIEKNLLERLVKFLQKNTIDVIVLSDYNKGVCTKQVCRRIVGIGRERNIPVVVDPKGLDWEKYRGTDFITPNLKELSEISGHRIENKDRSVEDAASGIREKYSIGNMLITRSEKGMTMISDKKTFHVHTEAKEVFDVSGAGDTVVGVLSLALGKGLGIFDSVCLANRAAGIVVAKLGTAFVEPEELEKSYSLKKGLKELPGEDLDRTILNLKRNKKRIVFTNGCFDIIHKGHVEILRKAKELGDVLIVGLNSDSSVRKIKGPDRPVNNQNDRMHVLSGIGYTDYIVIFNEDTPYELIKKIQPQFLVKGGDYKKEEIVGKEFAENIVVIDYIEGYSTSRVIKKMAGKL